MAHHLADVVARCAQRLREAGIEDAQEQALALVAFAADISTSQARVGIVTGTQVSDAVAEAVEELTVRRQRREPLQYIVGRAPFRYRDLAVGPGVFVPRPETEVVAQVAIDALARIDGPGGRRDLSLQGSPHTPHAGPLVVDLCSGSGAIALSVVTEVAHTRVVAVEREAEAYAWLERNAAELTSEQRERLTLVRGDVTDDTLLADLEGSVDVVVSNPPYVPQHEAPIQPEAQHDPNAALYGGDEDGLRVPRAVMATARRLLMPGGLFVMEHSSSQGSAAVEAIESLGAFADAVTMPDLAGLDRVLVARRT